MPCARSIEVSQNKELIIFEMIVYSLDYSFYFEFRFVIYKIHICILHII